MQKAQDEGSVHCACHRYYCGPAGATGLLDRLSTVARYEEDASATDRLALWDIALGLVAENPVLGVGPDNFTLYAPNTPHNAYLQIASEVGLPALFLYISILGSGLLSAWRARGLCRDFPDKSYLYAISQGFFCCQMAVVIQGFTTGLAHREVVYVFVTMGICVLNLAEITSNDGQKLESYLSSTTIYRVRHTFWNRLTWFRASRQARSLRPGWQHCGSQ